MKSSIAKGLLASLFLNVCLMTTAPAATVTLFTDDFPYAGSTTNSPSTTKWPSPYQGYSATTNAYPAGETAKLGKSASPYQGSLTTTNLAMQAGTLHVQVSGVAYSTTEKTLNIFVAGQQAALNFTTLVGGPLQTFTSDFTVAAGTYTVTFYSPKRCFLDDIVITETVSDSMVTLDAPVAYAATTTNDTSFTASWSSVANAESYLLSVDALTVVGSVTNAAPISGSPFTVATGTTSRSVTGLIQDSLYRYSVVAVGNGTTTGNSPASNAITLKTQVSAVVPIFTVTPATVAAVQELSPVNFIITATVGGSPATVTYTSGLPSGASYTFSGGSFAWTPALGQAGAYTLVFSVVSTDSQTYTRNVGVTVNTLPLTAPTGLAASNIAYNAFDASWNPVAAATQGYRVTVWTGSSATNTPTADVETFFETTDSNPVQPYGWTFTGITGEYMDRGLNEISFNDTGDTVVTRLYPQAVTSLAFRAQTRSTPATGDSELQIQASADGATWTPVAVYSTATDGDGDAENNLFSSATGGDLDKRLAILTSGGYRQFKFVYTKGKYNLGIGNIAAEYEGAGTKFVSGWYDTAVAGTDITVGGLRTARNYYVLVGAKNSTETKSAMLFLRTLDAPRATVLVVR